MHAYLVSPESDVWAQTLRTVPHDVYHLPGYARLCGRLDSGEARGFVATDGDCTLFVPLILREVPSPLCPGGTARDATVPYGYPGPMISCGAGSSGGEHESFLHRALEAMVARLASERIVAAFFRLHPLFALDPAVLSRFGPVIESGDTVAIDLTLPEQALWRQMRSNHRRDVTKARARGETADIDPTWSALPAFMDAYRETMARVGATSYYLFPEDYFVELRDALGGHIHLWTVRSGEDVVAGALFTECQGIVQYHLGGTLDRFLPGNPIKLLFHRAAEWFKQRGNRWLHLGGGVGGGRDSLFNFKLGFSPQTFPFRTWRLVLDATAYDELLTRAGRTPGSGLAPGSFFPAYRELTH
jgi:Acetyltransferase (GNAT) domain